MSVRWMSRVWSSPVPTQPTERLMLLALADNANDEGVCWPAVATLQRKCGLKTERGARKVLERLLGRDAGALPAGVVVVTVEHRDGRTSYYHLSTTPEPADRGERADRGEPGDRGTPERADRGGLSPRTGEPSSNRQKNHQQTRARARASAAVDKEGSVGEADPRVEALVGFGVERAVAAQLVREYPDRVGPALVRYQSENAEGRQHRPGWLVKCIRSGWTATAPAAQPGKSGARKGTGVPK